MKLSTGVIMKMHSLRHYCPNHLLSKIRLCKNRKLTVETGMRQHWLAGACAVMNSPPVLSCNFKNCFRNKAIFLKTQTNRHNYFPSFSISATWQMQIIGWQGIYLSICHSIGKGQLFARAWDNTPPWLCAERFISGTPPQSEMQIPSVISVDQCCHIMLSR